MPESGDPDVVFVSTTTPRGKLVDYILTRLSTAPPAGTTPAARCVTLFGVNSAVSAAVTIGEIIKRRRPDAVYSCKIGPAFDDPATAPEASSTTAASATTGAEQGKPSQKKGKKRSAPATADDAKSTAKAGADAPQKKYAIQLDFVVAFPDDTAAAT